NSLQSEPPRGPSPATNLPRLPTIQNFIRGHNDTLRPRNQIRSSSTIALPNHWLNSYSFHHSRINLPVTMQISSKGLAKPRVNDIQRMLFSRINSGEMTGMSVGATLK